MTIWPVSENVAITNGFTLIYSRDLVEEVIMRMFDEQIRLGDNQTLLSNTNATR